MNDLINRIYNSSIFNEILRRIEGENELHLHFPMSSLTSLLLIKLLKVTERPIVIITSEQEQSEKYYDDILSISGIENIVKIFHKPKTHDLLSQEVGNIDSFEALRKNKKLIYIFDIDSVIEKIAIKEDILDEVCRFSVGSEYNFNKIFTVLEKFQFEKKDFVFEPGDYAIRGGIVDIFPFIGRHPFRLEFSGDIVESIREFDESSQRSLKNIQEINISPNFFESENSDANKTLLSFINQESIIFLDGIEKIENRLKEESDNSINSEELWELIFNARKIINHFIKSGIKNIIDGNISSHPNFNSSLKICFQEIKKLSADNYTISILSDGMKRSENLKGLFQEMITDEDIEKINIIFSPVPVQNGFILKDEKIAVLTEHEIFNRTKARTYSKRKKIKGFTAKEVEALHRGEYVVHIDFGVGIFEKLERIKIGESEQECVKLKYMDGDYLFVNLNYINRIQKYNSQEGVIPRVSKLGSGEWDKLKSKTKKRIKDIARELIALYAKRKASSGFAFSTDSIWQKELEASFMYEDTPDQASATESVKKDMEKDNPMDRLICGDVGYGKTEVAIRAAFKAAMDSKQVAVLVPTTILAEQHFKTFKKRLSNYPVTIESLSRFRSHKEQKDILARLKERKVDIIIGTHRLLSKDVEFKDLGLLIIDEEHRFGVAAKEKLRKIKINVDTLTLTATPIPRTLNFSLLGARDLSIIETPPKNRLPIETEIIKFEDDIIRSAILKELGRGGQVYFVNDRVNNIEQIISRLKKIVPEAKIGIAHGQMNTHQLEKAMMNFFERKIDVLVCTKIVESGLDIPNVNTILVNRSDKFGLAELYQLRGRVGRSNTQAYSYFIVPGFEMLNQRALRRLQAIEEFTELSSGFKLALRDMEIRGVGNLLGAEQSGFVDAMGFDLYAKVLDEAVYELKEEEFKGLFDITQFQKKKIDSSVEIDKDAYLPDTYISNDSERFHYYQKLYDSENIENIYAIKDEIIDRFGKTTQVVENLIKIVILRIYLSNLKISKLNLKKNKLVLFFKSENFNDELSFNIFNKIIDILQKIKNISYFVRDVNGEVTLNITINLSDVDYLEYTSNLLMDLEIGCKEN